MKTKNKNKKEKIKQAEKSDAANFPTRANNHNHIT